MGIISSLSKGWTEIWLNLSEISLLVFAVLVAIGLVGEFWLDHNAPPGLRRPSKRQKRLKKLFESLVVIGVAVEAVCDGGIYAFESHLQAIFETETRAANARAVAAEEGAAMANERAANAEKEAALSNERAAVIEAKSRWRTISGPERDGFVNATKGVFKIPIRIRMGANAGSEVWSFAKKIREMLDEAGFAETNADLAIGEWPSDLNIYWKGGDVQMPSVIFLNNISGLGNVVDMRDAQKVLSTYPGYGGTNGSVRTEFSNDVMPGEPKAFVTDDHGIPILHLHFHDQAPFKMSAFSAVQSVFNAMGIQSESMTITNIPSGICEIFVNPK